MKYKSWKAQKGGENGYDKNWGRFGGHCVVPSVQPRRINDLLTFKISVGPVTLNASVHPNRLIMYDTFIFVRINFITMVEDENALN